MTGALDIGCGMTSVTLPGRVDVARACLEEYSRIRAQEDIRDADRRGRSMGEGASDTRLMDATCLRIASDIVGSLTDAEFDRLKARAQRRKEGA